MKRIVIAVLGIAALVVGYFQFVQKGNNPENATAQPKEQPIEKTRRTSLADRSDVPSIWPTEPVVENPGATNWLARMRTGDYPRLSGEEAEAYVTVNKRSAESLLAAYRATKDKMYLQEALKNFPNDPRVNFVGYFDALDNKTDYTDEERHAMLEHFAKSAPENSLVNYLTASDYFKSGESDKALDQFRNATTKSSLQDYSSEFMQNTEEAYRNAGYSETDAKAIAAETCVHPHLLHLKQTGIELLELTGRYQQSGDEARAQEARSIALQLADTLQDGNLINQLVGFSIERKILDTLDPHSAYDSSGRTVQNRIDELIQTQKNLRALAGPFEKLLPTMTPADQSAYFDRAKVFGEEAAMKWAVGKFGN